MLPPWPSPLTVIGQRRVGERPGGQRWSVIAHGCELCHARARRGSGQPCLLSAGAGCLLLRRSQLLQQMGRGWSERRAVSSVTAERWLGPRTHDVSNPTLQNPRQTARFPRRSEFGLDTAPLQETPPLNDCPRHAGASVAGANPLLPHRSCIAASPRTPFSHGPHVAPLKQLMTEGSSSTGCPSRRPQACSSMQHRGRRRSYPLRWALTLLCLALLPLHATGEPSRGLERCWRVSEW